jgi:hypothetical protein
MAWADASGDREEGIGSDDLLADPDFEFGMCERSERAGENDESQ